MITLLAVLAIAQAGELHQAVRSCGVDRMRELLLRKPSLNDLDEKGMTALHIAIDSRQRACVWLLIDAGADRKVRDRQGRTGFDAAAQAGDPRIEFMLKNFGQPAGQEAKEAMPWTLEYSVMRRQTDVTKMLLAVGADPNAPGKGGTTPLADAALKGDLDIVRALLERGAKPDAISQAGTQPIHDAALGGNADVIQELVKHGASVNTRTRDELLTPLHIAAAMGKVEAVKALIALVADMTAQDSKGRTPLDAAEGAGLTEVVGLLKRASK